MSTGSISPAAGSSSTGASTTEPHRGCPPALRYRHAVPRPVCAAPGAGHHASGLRVGQVDVHLWPLRDHADDPYRRVDDRPYGGGPAWSCSPSRSSARWRRSRPIAARARRSCTSPGGPQVGPGPGRGPRRRRRRRAAVRPLRRRGQRVVDRHVHDGDQPGRLRALGGELPALVLLDAVARLQEGVLNAPSHEQDSFSTACSRGRPTVGPRFCRTAEACRRCCFRVTRRYRALAQGARARHHRAPPAGPDRRRPRVGAAQPSRRGLSARLAPIISGFAILCRAP